MSTKLTRTRRVRWQHEGRWVSGWVMVGNLEFDDYGEPCLLRIGKYDMCIGTPLTAKCADVLLIHDDLTSDIYLVPADAVEDEPRRKDYEGERIHGTAGQPGGDLPAGDCPG